MVPDSHLYDCLSHIQNDHCWFTLHNTGDLDKTLTVACTTMLCFRSPCIFHLMLDLVIAAFDFSLVDIMLVGGISNQALRSMFWWLLLLQYDCPHRPYPPGSLYVVSKRCPLAFTHFCNWSELLKCVILCQEWHHSKVSPNLLHLFSSPNSLVTYFEHTGVPEVHFCGKIWNSSPNINAWNRNGTFNRNNGSTYLHPSSQN